MARRPLDVDPLEIDETFRALLTCTDLDALFDFVVQNEVVRSPAFVQVMHNEYERAPIAHPDQAEAFGELYYRLMFLLHTYAYDLRCNEARTGPAPSEPPVAGPLVPPFHQVVLAALGGRIPEFSGVSLDPARDLDRIREVLATNTGHAVDLPPYRATRGVGWVLLHLECARCDHTYASVRPHFIDLVAAPELAGPVAAGAFACPGCPKCGEVCAHVALRLLEDPPFAADPLASLGCAVRIERRLFVYVPPPGTRQSPDWDLVIQSRFELRLEELGWRTPPPHDPRPGEGAMFCAAYTAEQLTTLVNQGV